MEKPLIISIITPSFNHAEFIEETIRSVIYQSGDFYIDYIVMDGGSSDQTAGILKRYDDEIRMHTVEFRLKDRIFHRPSSAGSKLNCLGISYRWVSEKDQGQADAINKGLRLAVGDIVAFLNSDDTYYPGALAVIATQDWKGTDFIYGKGMWTSREGHELLPYPTFKPNKYHFKYQCTLCQPAVFMKRESYEKLGEFSQEFKVIFDFEYWMRAVFQKMKFTFTDSFLATSRFYMENKTMAQKSIQVSEVPALLKKYYDKPFNRYDKLMLLLARHTIHKKTIGRVNKLHELIHSEVRYGKK